MTTTIETPLDYENGDYSSLEVLGYTVVIDHETGLIFAVLGSEPVTPGILKMIGEKIEEKREETAAEVRRTGMGWARPKAKGGTHDRT